jgi:phosphoribosylformylglycinamidine cyclo-ligase
MSVNDILVQGAEPRFFLDYFACGKLDVPTATSVVKGIATGCEQAGCALIGGETAEMPSMYPDGEYDLAGFAVGAVEKSQIIDGTKIAPVEVAKPDLEADFHGRKLADVLMAPTRIYVKPLLALMASMEVKGLVHITGGGLVENIPRVLSDKLTAVLDAKAWSLPPLFQWLQQHGGVADAEMHRVFNCGIGMTVIVSRENADAAMAQLQAAGETVYRIGEIRARAEGEAQTIVQ